MTSSIRLLPSASAALLALSLLAGCAVGPAFVKPETPSPPDWNTWRSGDASLAVPPPRVDALPQDWWRLFNDPVLTQLEQRALQASPDLQTAALHYAQARVQRRASEAQGWPSLNLGGGITRRRDSEWGPGTRIIDAITPNRQPLIDILSQPYTDYQVGFDASWELDLWGRVARSLDAADADTASQAALLRSAQLSVASEVARNYFELRTTQRQVRLAREDIAALSDRLGLLQARVDAGALDHFDLDRQRAELDGVKAQLPPLLAQEAASANQIALLLGEHPGALRDTLAPVPAAAQDAQAALPDLSVGIPSEVAQRRPDIQAAEASLRKATANIGVATAELYPSVRIGAKFGYDSYLDSEFGTWASRTWSIGPSFDLPLFDHGRRKSVVALRELQQQEAAINFQRTVLKAWQEIDDAFSGYAAERQQAERLAARMASARSAYQLAQARYDGGTVDYTAVLDSQRSYLQARRDLAGSQGRLSARYVAVNKAIGNVPQATDTVVGAAGE